jgi:hypothetical protein
MEKTLRASILNYIPRNDIISISVIYDNNNPLIDF